MCFNYSLNTSIKSLESRFNANIKQEIKLPVYHANAFSFREMPVITYHESNDIELFRWGLIPGSIRYDIQAEKIKKFTINAKSETVFEKPSFKNSILFKRCLIPATGYFEWQHVNKEKNPYFIYLTDRKIFSFAGIWDTYLSEDGKEINTFSILTKEADEFNAKIHNSKKRMPIILEEEYEKQWLTPNLDKNTIHCIMKKGDFKYDAYRVSRILGSKKANTNVEMILNKEEDQNKGYTIFP
jgi:putative SOS response-associated peptidase YedK